LSCITQDKYLRSGKPEAPGPGRTIRSLGVNAIIPVAVKLVAFDLVPLAGARQKVMNLNAQSGLLREATEL